jgi:hypothetical protein
MVWEPGGGADGIVPDWVMEDPDEAETRLDEWLHGVRDRLDAVQHVSMEIGALRVSASGARGAVTVEVDGSGGLSRLRLTQEIGRFTPSQLAEEIMAVLRRAQVLLEERADEIAVGTFQERPETRAALRNGLRRRLGADDQDSPDQGRGQGQGPRDGGLRW